MYWSYALNTIDGNDTQNKHSLSYLFFLFRKLYVPIFVPFENADFDMENVTSKKCLLMKGLRFLLFFIF